MRADATLTLALLLAACLAGCETTEKSCTLIGCQSGLGIAFETAAWPAGTWKVDAQTPTGLRTCTTTLPLPTNGQAQCSGDLMLLTSGSALPAVQHSLGGIQLPDTPTQVTVTVQHDGTTVAQKTFQPAYATSQPNGAGCDPICTQASDKLTW